MRRILIFLAILLAACHSVNPSKPAPVLTHAGTPTAPVLPSPTMTIPPSPLAPAVSPTLAATPAPPATGTAVPSPSPTPLVVPVIVPTQPDTYTVMLHPENGLYVGDQVSFEIISPPGINTSARKAQVQVDAPNGPVFGPAGFGVFGLGNRIQATLIWAWNTKGVAPGEHTLTYSVQPGGPTWSQTVNLLPESDVPFPQPDAHWASARTRCCKLNYITGTAAERDIATLEKEADQQALDAVERMGTTFTRPITVTLLPRVLGQGGFASDEISISYLDRNYAGDQFDLVLHHEMIHILDGRLGGDLRPTMLVEGLAVYLTGGHFKRGPLLPRAAALLQMTQATPLGEQSWYIPLTQLANDFYPSQHEIGYLEGAALIEYMVDRWTWSGFSRFYRDIHSTSSGSQVEAMDIALKKHFNISFNDLEQNFLEFLRQQPVPAGIPEDVRYTVNYYDTVRRYQLALDPAAYFRAAWLLDNKDMRARGIVADYLRHPSALDNLALETLLVSTDQALVADQYPQVNRLLAAANSVLDAIARGQPDPFQADLLAADYYAIAQAIVAMKDQPQRIEINANTAKAWITRDSTILDQVAFEKITGTWELQSIQNSSQANVQVNPALTLLMNLVTMRDPG
ncbi:MAG: hypothetical protein ACM3PY_12660 [Omnitrophica WOR_2 bacterium]